MGFLLQGHSARNIPVTRRFAPPFPGQQRGNFGGQQQAEEDDFWVQVFSTRFYDFCIADAYGFLEAPHPPPR
jgi:hypothetical protein